MQNQNLPYKEGFGTWSYFGRDAKHYHIRKFLAVVYFGRSAKNYHIRKVLVPSYLGHVLSLAAVRAKRPHTTCRSCFSPPCYTQALTALPKATLFAPLLSFGFLHPFFHSFPFSRAIHGHYSRLSYRLLPTCCSLRSWQFLRPTCLSLAAGCGVFCSTQSY